MGNNSSQLLVTEIKKLNGLVALSCLTYVYLSPSVENAEIILSIIYRGITGG